MASNPLGGLLGGLVPSPAVAIKEAVLAVFLGLEAKDILGAIESGQITKLDDIPAFLERELEHAVQDAEQQFGTPLWELLVRAPAGLDAAQLDNGQAKDAVAMVKRMLGFGLALPLLTARLEAVLKGILGDHAPEGLLAAIRELPNEIGVNFFIGTVLERIFETAVATPLEEAIAEQTRPARFDFRVIKALLTKHHIDRAQAEQYLARIGYRDQDLKPILDLAEAFLSVADLQALFLEGTWTEIQVRQYLGSLGYVPSDVDALIDLYLTKAETQGGQQLRATARSGYLDNRITEEQYRALLISVNTPERSVNYEVESANLIKTWGRQHLTVANIKTLHAEGHVNDRQAEARLLELGFTEADAADLVVSWTTEKRASHAGLTVNHILSYQLGHVITPAQSLQLLLATGLRVEDAELLVANPGHLGGIYAHELTPATVVTALKDGILGVEDAKAELAQLGVAPAEIDLRVAIAVHQAVRGGKLRAAHKNVTEAQVLEAFKLGLASSSWVLSELVTLGYSDADAQLLLAIESTKLSGGVPPSGWVVLS